jgi:hypothetical protein
VNSRVTIRRRQAPGLSDPRGRVCEHVVPLNGIPFIVRVKVGDNGKLDAVEVIVLDEDLGAHAGVDAGGGAVLEVRAGLQC